MSNCRALTLTGLCALLLVACGIPGTQVRNSASTAGTPDESSSQSFSTPSTPARPSVSAPTPLPPTFDAYQNACVQLKALREKAWGLAPPMALSTPTDAARQAQFIAFLIDATRVTLLEDFGDGRVADARLRVAGFADTLRELRKSARVYAQSGSRESYSAWEKAWFVADGSAAVLTYGCR